MSGGSPQDDQPKTTACVVPWMSLLPHFREFTVWVKAEARPHVATATLKKLFRAKARHTVARRFHGIRIAKGSNALIRGYSAGMRLFLSYSAAEAMGEVVESHVTSWELYDKSLEPPLRRIAAPLPARDDVLSKGVRQSVAAFLARDHDNVRVVATALRHLIAHGDFTPTGAGMMTKVGAHAIEQLGNHLLAESERRFAAWFKEVAS